MANETETTVAEPDQYQSLVNRIMGSEATSSPPVDTPPVITPDNQTETNGQPVPPAEPVVSTEAKPADEFDEILQLMETETKADEEPATDKPTADTPEITSPIVIPEGYQELEVDDGKKVLVPVSDVEVIKPYLLRHQDYSRKTAELAEEKRKTQSAYDAFESAKADIESARQEILSEKEKYVFNLPYIPKPLESQYIDIYATKEDQILQQNQYIKDLRSWEELQNKKAEFREKQAKVSVEAEDINAKFQEKYGEEIFNQVNKDIAKYYKAIKNDHVIAPPKDVMEVFYKGKNFDTLVAEEKKKWINELKKKYTEKKTTSKAPVVTPSTNGVLQPPSIQMGGNPNPNAEVDRYDSLVAKIKKGV